MKVRLTQIEQERLLMSALRGDITLFPERVAALLTGEAALTIEEAAALYLYLEEKY